MKRNSIFRVLSILVVAILLIKSEAVFAKDKKIGIQLYSVMDAMKKDPQTYINRLTRMGYNVFELVQWGGGS